MVRSDQGRSPCPFPKDGAPHRAGFSLRRLGGVAGLGNRPKVHRSDRTGGGVASELDTDGVVMDPDVLTRTMLGLDDRTILGSDAVQQRHRDERAEENRVQKSRNGPLRQTSGQSPSILAGSAQEPWSGFGIRSYTKRPRWGSVRWNEHLRGPRHPRARARSAR